MGAGCWVEPFCLEIGIGTGLGIQCDWRKYMEWQHTSLMSPSWALKVSRSFSSPLSESRVQTLMRWSIDAVKTRDPSKFTCRATTLSL